MNVQQTCTKKPLLKGVLTVKESDPRRNHEKKETALETVKMWANK